MTPFMELIPSHIKLGRPSGFPTKIRFAFCFSLTLRATYFAHLVLPTVFDKEYKS